MGQWDSLVQRDASHGRYDWDIDWVMRPDGSSPSFASAQSLHSLQSGMESAAPPRRLSAANSTADSLPSSLPSLHSPASLAGSGSWSQYGWDVDAPTQMDTGTQMIRPADADAGTQMMQALQGGTIAGTGTQTFRHSYAEAGTQMSHPTYADTGTQAFQPSYAEAGTQMSRPTYADAGTQAIRPTYADAGTQAIRPTYADAGAQTMARPLQTEITPAPPARASQATQASAPRSVRPQQVDGSTQTTTSLLDGPSRDVPFLDRPPA